MHTVVPHGTNEFIKPGDSGSLVLLNELTSNDKVTVLGLVMGGEVPEENEEVNGPRGGYFTTIDFVFDHIEETIGGRIVYPENRGQLSGVYPQIV